MRHRLPYGTVDRQVRRPCSAACLDRRPGRESLEARAVKTAVPGPVISGSARDANVPELGMVPAEYGLARCNETDSYAGADRDVRVIGQPPAGAPTAFGERRGNDVGRYAHGVRKPLGKEPGDVHISPAFLGRHADPAEIGRVRPQLQRAEARQSESAARAVSRLPVPQDPGDTAQCCRRIALSLDRDSLPDVIGCAADQALALRSAQFHSTQQGFRMRHRR